MSKILIFALLCATAFTLRAHLQSQYPGSTTLVGAYTTGDVTKPDTEIDTYIRSQFPDLADAKLTKVETQVVSGINYRYTYLKDGVTWSIVVWDQPWLKNRQVTEIEKVEIKTNPDGKKVQVTTNTRIEDRKFADVARAYFKPAAAA